jgi:hypothetical protein
MEVPSMGLHLVAAGVGVERAGVTAHEVERRLSAAGATEAP